MGKTVYSGQSRRVASHSCHAIGAARGSSLPAFSPLFSTCFERLGFVCAADGSSALGQERSATDASLRPVGRIEESFLKNVLPEVPGIPKLRSTFSSDRVER